VQQFKITTDSTTVILADLGGRTFVHPTVDYDMLADEEFSYDELSSSDDLQNAISNGSLTVKNELDQDISDNPFGVRLTIKDDTSYVKSNVDVLDLGELIRADQDGNFEINVDSDHDIDDHNDVPIKPLGGEYVLAVDSTANIHWSDFEFVGFLRDSLNLVFRENPTYNGAIPLLGWYNTSDTGVGLSSGSPVTASQPGYNSHFCLNITGLSGSPFTIRVTGTTVNDITGTYTTGDTEDLNISTSGLYQTTKKWINTPQFNILEGGKSCTISIYYTEYWILGGNNDYTVYGCRFEWTPDQNNWDIVVKLQKVHSDGSLSTFDTIEFHSTDSIKRAGESRTGIYFRNDYDIDVDGDLPEGLIVKIENQQGIGSLFLEVKIRV